MKSMNDENIKDWVIACFVVLVLILLIVIVMMAMVYRRYRKDMDVLLGHEAIVAGWREFLHDARDIMNATRLWTKLGIMKTDEQKETVKELNLVKDELKKTVEKSQTHGA